MKVLIIDDAAEIRYAAGIGLGRIGRMQVLEAEDGSQGLALARAERPDAILLDLHMPGLSGAQVLTALKENPDTAAIPVILLSASEGRAEALAAAQGAAKVIAKPFDIIALAQVVRSVADKASRSVGNSR